MPGDLERQLGELAGKLTAVLPTLERVEGKVDEQSKKIASLEKEVSMSREALDRECETVKERIQDGDRAFEGLRIEQAGLKRDIADHGKEIDTIKKGGQETGKKWWDVVLLILSAVLGAGGMAVLHKLLGG